MEIRSIIFKNIKYILILLPFLSFFILNTAAAQQNKNEKQKHVNDSTLLMRRNMIHSRSSMVMPFGMNKVTHYFIKTDNGGILMIKVKNSKDTIQIDLIRDHLKKEHKLFSEADFQDPQTLHGVNMPGLDVLTKSKDKYKVEYKDLRYGAQLTFSSKDLKVIKAFHLWFDAQLKDHGSDARSKE